MRLILDQFFIHEFVGKKQVTALIHQPAREFWFYETKFPLNYISYYYLKKMVIKLREYNNTAVSYSTKIGLEELGFKRVFIVPPCLNVTPLSNVKEKEANPTVIFIGRLKKAKLPHHALQPFSIIKREIHDAKMCIFGD
jgi:glycosyltransferase involved in cell wall biosynthesis